MVVGCTRAMQEIISVHRKGRLDVNLNKRLDQNGATKIQSNKHAASTTPQREHLLCAALRTTSNAAAQPPLSAATIFFTLQGASNERTDASVRHTTTLELKLACFAVDETYPAKRRPTRQQKHRPSAPHRCTLYTPATPLPARERRTAKRDDDRPSK